MSDPNKEVRCSVKGCDRVASVVTGLCERHRTNPTVDLLPGECLSCRYGVPEDGYARCADCREKQREAAAERRTITRRAETRQQRERRSERRARGLCIACGEPTELNAARCPKHLAQERERQRRRREYD